MWCRGFARPWGPWSFNPRSLGLSSDSGYGCRGLGPPLCPDGGEGLTLAQWNHLLGGSLVGPALPPPGRARYPGEGFRGRLPADPAFPTGGVRRIWAPPGPRFPCMGPSRAGPLLNLGGRGSSGPLVRPRGSGLRLSGGARSSRAQSGPGIRSSLGTFPLGSSRVPFRLRLPGGVPAPLRAFPGCSVTCRLSAAGSFQWPMVLLSFCQSWDAVVRWLRGVPPSD